ncbi:unnamed protein product [Musa acuminata subsp. malaccensis]|uniref:(wild Malaysian banana) hypothetical protein n=1 Tax=Musa acuminata subsp. malaccensis TaxID=214687 RepID=A0A804HWC4_MUSAM|nr:unnamed protein product [Musa acuminata subsp. malaccensis]
MSFLIPKFQQLTGINMVMFYAPVLFKTIGFGDDASLMAAIITGMVNAFATVVSILTVDRIGRRVLFLEGGVQMIIAQVVVGTLIGIKFGTSGQGDVSKPYAIFVVLFICVFVSGFAWSWGPLGWLVPSEIFHLEINRNKYKYKYKYKYIYIYLFIYLYIYVLPKLS